ncbi:MAG: 2'-5' RNA ligase family protein [Microcoleus sp.]
MNPLKQRFFIALVPPLEIQQQITQIKEYFAEHYNSRRALQSPPHITLQPPFEWAMADVPKLEECLKGFAAGRLPIPITLSGFAAFAPRVIYVDVVKSPALLELQTDLMSYVGENLGIVDRVSQTRSFVPHMTVAFSDLTKPNFDAAWLEFKGRSIFFEFTAAELILLIHDGSQWNVATEFLFSGS